jgi:hypothetical protein
VRALTKTNSCVNMTFWLRSCFSEKGSSRFYFGKVTQEPLNKRTYHADDFVLAPIVVVITH